MGPCQAADYWTQVIELPRFQGPIRLDYPLDEFRSSWIDHEIRLGVEGSFGSPGSEAMTVLKGGNSGFRDPIREVVRDSSRWRAIRDTLYPDLKAGSEPLVNFGREMLVVAAGPHSGAGDSVVITGITHSQQDMKVSVVLYQGCSPAQISTRPFHVVRIPRWQGKPVFEEQVVIDPECI
jgi:hypothetical protein